MRFFGGEPRRLLRFLARDAAGDGEADEGHDAGEQRERQEGQPRHEAQHRHEQRRDEESARITRELAEHRRVRRAARAALGDEQTGGERDDERRDLGDEAVADRELGENVRGRRERQPVARDADHDAPENVDRQDDEGGDRVAAHELGGAVHRAEESALLFELAPA